MSGIEKRLRHEADCLGEDTCVSDLLYEAAERIKELESWAIARDNEQGRQIKKRDDRIKELEATDYAACYAASVYETQKREIDTLKQQLDAVRWNIPDPDNPPLDSNLLIQVDLSNGEVNEAHVYLDEDDCETMHYADDYGDVYTDWNWSDVSRYIKTSSIPTNTGRE